MIVSNPVRKSKALPPHQQKIIEPFSLPEIETILKKAKGKKNLVVTLFMIGMQTDELKGTIFDKLVS